VINCNNARRKPEIRVWLYLFSNHKVFEHLTTTWRLPNRHRSFVRMTVLKNFDYCYSISEIKDMPIAFTSWAIRLLWRWLIICANMEGYWMTELLNYYLEINTGFGRAVGVKRLTLFSDSRISPLTKAMKPHMKVNWQHSVWVRWDSVLRLLREGIAQSV
jgi:hypothetical protein